jgi:hypothetical protein
MSIRTERDGDRMKETVTQQKIKEICVPALMGRLTGGSALHLKIDLDESEYKSS